MLSFLRYTTERLYSTFLAVLGILVSLVAIYGALVGGEVVAEQTFNVEIDLPILSKAEQALDKYLADQN